MSGTLLWIVLVVLALVGFRSALQYHPVATLCALGAVVLVVAGAAGRRELEK
jgi:peptidoglycan/LPS O-acetylase OafA/YrhL